MKLSNFNYTSICISIKRAEFFKHHVRNGMVMQESKIGTSPKWKNKKKVLCCTYLVAVISSCSFWTIPLAVAFSRISSHATLHIEQARCYIYGVKHAAWQIENKRQIKKLEPFLSSSCTRSQRVLVLTLRRRAAPRRGFTRSSLWNQFSTCHIRCLDAN